MRLLTLILFCLSFISKSYSQNFVRVKDIYPGVSSSMPQYFFRATENKVYFFAASPNSAGFSLYVTDGTENGTTLLLSEVSAPMSYNNPYDEDNFLTYNGNLVFRARVGNSSFYQLWFSNGTSSGTYPLTNFNSNVSIYSIIELNDYIYFYGTSTVGDAIYRAYTLLPESVQARVALSSDQRGSRLVKSNGKIYRIARYEIVELNDTDETIIFTDMNHCIGGRAVLNNKLVYNMMSCSTVDPLFYATRAFDFSSKTISTLSLELNVRIENFSNLESKQKVFNNKLYTAYLGKKPVSGPGSKTDVLYLTTTDGTNINVHSVYFYDSATIKFNGFKEFNNKLYFAISFTPTVAPTNEVQTTIYEVGPTSNFAIFQTRDVASNYKFKQSNYAVLANNKVVFIADTNSFVQERSNLHITNNSTSFMPILSSSNQENIDASQLTYLNSNTVLISARLGNSQNDVGQELFKFSLSANGVEHRVNSNLKLLPNPSSDFVEILNTSELIRIDLFDIKGKLIGTYESSSIDVSKLEQGMYLLKVYEKKYSTNLKFIKQ